MKCTLIKLLSQSREGEKDAVTVQLVVVGDETLQGRKRTYSLNSKTVMKKPFRNLLVIIRRIMN